jgi:hypothetical protein
MRTCSIVLDADPEGGDTVTVPALPGCITQGKTTEEWIATHTRRSLYSWKTLRLPASPSRRKSNIRSSFK